MIENFDKDDDDIYTMEDFIEHCKSGLFIDYDGFGVYATENSKTKIIVRPSEILSNKYDKTFTHVVWYNR